MNDDYAIYSKIRTYIAAEFGERHIVSSVMLKTVDEPSRFDGPVFLAAILLKASEESLRATLEQAPPGDTEFLRKHYARGREVTCIFDSSGEEIERHFEGKAYFSDYRTIKI